MALNSHWWGLPQVSFLSQENVCCDKTRLSLRQTFFFWKILLWQKMSFVMTKVCLSWQNFCRDKHMFVMTNICRNKSKLCLSRQTFCHGKHTSVATEDMFCQDKTFVATKLIFVAVPTNGTKQHENFHHALYQHSFKHSAQRHHSQK